MENNQESSAESLISKYLKDNNVFFIREYKIDGKDFCDFAFNLKKEGKVQFYDFGYFKCDFFLKDLNTVIEFDGEQHSNFDVFKLLQTRSWKKERDFYDYLVKVNGLEEQLKGAFQEYKDSDIIKEEYLKSIGVNFYRITYKDDIISKLNEILNIKPLTLF